MKYRPEQIQNMTVLTRDGIRFSMTLAGPFRRFLGWLIDVAAIMAISSILELIPLLLVPVSADIGLALRTVVLFSVSQGYRIALEWWFSGKTLGKQVLGMRVMDAELTGLTFYQVVVRNLARFVDSLPVLYGLGGLVCFFHPQHQRLGDIAGQTVVVYSPETRQPDVSRMMEDWHNSFADHPHLEARLRKKTEPEEGRLAVQALLRRDQLDPDERVKLFERLEDYFQEKVTFPDETTFGLTPEQYVRNVVETLFRKRNEKFEHDRSTSSGTSSKTTSSKPEQSSPPS
jgi:uncharacterized RDD family membrane protein YckC